jgi:hypothetical protein
LKKLFLSKNFSSSVLLLPAAVLLDAIGLAQNL